MIRLTWFGHAAVGLEGEDARGRARAILIDPYEPGGFGGLMGYPPIDFKPDTILISHLHSDHAHVAPFPEARVLGPEQWAARAWDEALALEAVEVDHDAFGGRLRGGTSWMLRLRLGGVTVLHGGDVGASPTAEALEPLRGVELAILPCGGFYTVDATEAVELTLRLGARRVLPLHTRTPWCALPHLADGAGFAARLPAVEVLRVARGEAVEVE